MRNYLFTLLCGFFLLPSCNDDEVQDLGLPCNDIEVSYYGNVVCHDSELAAAVTLEDGHQLILSNFFSYVDSATVTTGDTFLIEYENLDSSLVMSGILCGPTVVAPVAELICLQ